MFRQGLDFSSQPGSRACGGGLDPHTGLCAARYHDPGCLEVLRGSPNVAPPGELVTALGEAHEAAQRIRVVVEKLRGVRTA